MSEQLWLELPPISSQAPRRLLVFLHAAGSSPERFAPIGIAWQLRFPGATGALMQGLRRFGDGADWFDARNADGQAAQRTRAAAETLSQRIGGLQAQLSIAPERTIVIGHAQGATLALELARLHPQRLAIVVGYAARLSRPVQPADRFGPTVHLIHGEFDSVVPAVHAQQAFRGLQAIGADATLDLVEDESHAIGQDLVNLGTTRVMQTLFRGRHRTVTRPTSLH